MSKLCLHLRRPGFRGEAPRRGCGLNPGGRCPAGGLPADAEQSGRESSALQAWEGLVAWAVRTGAVSPRGLPQLAWSWSSPGAAYPCCLWGRLWAAGPRPSEPSPSGSWCTPGSGGGRACSHLTSEAPPPTLGRLLSAWHCWHAVGWGVGYVESCLVSGPIGSPVGPWLSPCGWDVAGQGKEEKKGMKGPHCLIDPGGLHGGGGTENSFH